MNPFNPAFAAKVHAKRRLLAGGGVAGGHGETHGEAHVPVHVAFARAVAGPLRREAEARDASPQVLAAALVAAAIERGMVDELLAGRAPERLCGGQGRRADGLTLFQCAVIYLVGHHADSRGVCRLLNRDFARLTGRVSGSWIGVALERLESRGFVQRCPREGCLRPRRLTPLGRAVFDTLDGGILDGGVGAVGSGQSAFRRAQGGGEWR